MIASKLLTRLVLVSEFFHNGYSQGFMFCFVPKTGTVLRTQNLKRTPQRRAALSRQTAAVARNALHSTSRATAVFLSASLTGFTFKWPDGLQL